MQEWFRIDSPHRYAFEQPASRTIPENVFRGRGEVRAEPMHVQIIASQPEWNLNGAPFFPKDRIPIRDHSAATLYRLTSAEKRNRRMPR
jgi:hypothetical protein